MPRRRHVDVNVTLTTGRVPSGAASAAAGRTSSEAECEERALLLLQGKELLLRPHRGIGRGMLEAVRDGSARHKRLGRGGLRRRRRGVMVVQVGRATGYGLPVL